MKLINSSPGALVGTTKGVDQLTNAYKTIVSKMWDNAEAILEQVAAAKGNREKLAECINLLNSLTVSCRQFGFHASVKFATDRGDLAVLDSVSRHPLLGPILIYLDNTDVNDAVYIDWKITVYTEGIFFKKLVTDIDYSFTNRSPFISEVLK